MVIAPQTQVYLLKDVPLDRSKQNTILFSSREQQTNYMLSKVSAGFPNFTYVRQNKSIRVSVNADKIYNCNYCMYKNASYGDKWFYAFIIDIEYVNNEVSAVYIEMDNFQSWLFEMEIGQCFVEREHVSDDSIGLHTVPEPVEYGEVVPQQKGEYYFTDWRVILKYVPRSIEDITDKPVASGTVLQHQYTGANYVVLPLDAVEINGNINGLLSLGYTITSVYMCPYTITGSQVSEIDINTNVSRPTVFYYKTSILPQDGNSYKPKNNKLFTFPYTFLRATNGEDGSCDYKWEDSVSGEYANMHLEMTCANAVGCRLYPTLTTVTNNRMESVSITNFPKCDWNENAFVSSYGNGLIANTISNLLSFGGQFSGINSTLGSLFKPKELKGNASTPYTSVASNHYGFEFYVMAIKGEYAKIVDDFFTRFGYQVNRYKVPNLRSRTSFNYVKTRDAHVHGEVPTSAITEIETMLNNGVTLWHTNDVGNYELNNSTV